MLILGGSQGSLLLNRLLPPALAQLAQRGLDLRIRHQAGAQWLEVVRTSYTDLGLDAVVNDFISEPWQALAEADLVVARGGTLTVAELAAAGRPAIMVPASNGGQLANARAMVRGGGAQLVEEDRATSGLLADHLYELLTDSLRLLKMAAAVRTMAIPDAARLIALRLRAVGGLP